MKKGTNMMMITFSEGDEPEINDTWILLDIQSTVDMFSNHHLLQDIIWVRKQIQICYNSRIRATKFVGTIPGYGEIWYDQHGIGNILSFEEHQKRIPYII